MSRPNIWIVGNWKQNQLRSESRQLAREIAEGLPPLLGEQDRVRVGIAPPYLSLDAVNEVRGTHIELSAQDVAGQESGAFTGEIGSEMLRECGVTTAIIGHSERRAHFGDDDTLVQKKVRAALEGGLRVILCIGEGLDVREKGEHESVVISQLSSALSQVQPETSCDRFIVAYEPVWAIGTGKTASPEQASEMHRAIRRELSRHFGSASDRSILYGGSVKPGNAAALLAAGEIDGFLVGGASLDRESFLDIVRAAAEASSR